MNYVDQIEYNKLKNFLMVENQSALEDSIPVKRNFSIKERIARLSEDEKEKLKQYVEAIKEIKKEIYELIHEPIEEEGGNMSSGLTLTPEEEG